jgi:uroporphyrinogen decarboxylase
MTNKERVNAILNYEKADRMPIVSFGYWVETLEKWYNEGHITLEEWQGYVKNGDNSESDRSVMKKLGFDFNWNSCFGGNTLLNPRFEEKVIEELPNNQIKIIDENGLIVIVKKNVVSIPAEVGHTLTDRKSWEELYLPKLQYSEDRINFDRLNEYKKGLDNDLPVGIHCGSLIGNIRNIVGVEGLSYIYADDGELFKEIVDTVGDLCYKVAERILKEGYKFDYAHYWEDICFKNGPLVIPRVFDELVGPHYKKISNLINSYDINIISVDCDGLIDTLIPTWLDNGVNIMFPIEVGTWSASLSPWREKYGKQIRGVGGMNKTVFSKDFKAIDEEIERLKPIIELGGYIPCPDHRIAPDAKFENVKYYCEQLLKTETK